MMRAPTAADLAVDAALWRPQRKMDVATFSPARAAAHCAAQAASEIGRQLARPKPDDSHTALQWLDDWEALVGVAVGADRPYRAALRTVDLMLLLLDPDLNEVASLSLEHRTTDAARTWIVEQAAHYTGAAPNSTLPPLPEMPPDACFRAAPITPGPAAGHEALTAAFANADLMLRRVVETVEGAAPIRCWPHHFDIATLITLPESEFGKGRTIGVGMTPGDSTDPLPYWYVTPWPYPGNKSLPPLEGEGRWHTTGWTGALLSHSAITWSMTADAQAERLAEFLASAIAACIELQAQRPPSHR